MPILTDSEFLILSRRNISNGLDDLLLSLKEQVEELSLLEIEPNRFEYLVIDVYDEFSPIVPEVGAYTLKYPDNTFVLKELAIFLNEPPVGSDFLVDVKSYASADEGASLVSILQEPLKIENGKLASPVYDGASLSEVYGSTVRFDILQVGATEGGAGFKIYAKLEKVEEVA